MRQFTIQSAALVVLCIAIGLGWYCERQRMLTQISECDDKIVQVEAANRALKTAYISHYLSQRSRNSRFRIDREEFVLRLGDVGEMRYVPALIYALKDRDHLVTAAAQQSLRKIARTQGVPSDIGVTSHPIPESKIVAWRNWYRQACPSEDPFFHPMEYVDLSR